MLCDVYVNPEGAIQGSPGNGKSNDWNSEDPPRNYLGERIFHWVLCVCGKRTGLTRSESAILSGWPKLHTRGEVSGAKQPKNHHGVDPISLQGGQLQASGEADLATTQVGQKRDP